MYSLASDLSDLFMRNSLLPVHLLILNATRNFLTDIKAKPHKYRNS